MKSTYGGFAQETTSIFVICVSEGKSINQEKVPNLLIRIILGYAVITNKPPTSQWLTQQRFITCSRKLNPGQAVLHLVDLPTKTCDYKVHTWQRRKKWRKHIGSELPQPEVTPITFAQSSLASTSYVVPTWWQARRGNVENYMVIQWLLSRSNLYRP